MAVLCPKCDRRWPHVCDFCEYYQFNGKDIDGKHGAVYIDEGCCSLHFLPSDPGDGCDYFHCINAI